MSKLIALFIVTISFTAFSQSIDGPQPCTYCTSIEDALADPERVTYLNLRASGLEEAPMAINQLVNLQTLDLSQNVIDRIDFSSLRLEQLSELNLSNNPGFDALNMAGISESMPNLTKLNLCSSVIRHVSDELSELKKLTALDVSDNAILFLPNELTGLRILDASNNNLTDVNFLIESWEMEFLDISGNENLSYKNLARALGFKERLSELTISPSDKWRKSLPTELSSIGLKTLTLKGGRLADPNFQITKNDSLTKIVFDNVNIVSPIRLKNWINRFESLKTIEYANMKVPDYLDEIVSVDKMRFDNCRFEDKMELRSVKPTIKIEAVQTNIRTEGFIGNSKVLELDEESPKELFEDFAVSPDMAMNQLEAFATSRPTEFTFESSRPPRVTMDFTSFDIPSEAFLTQSGQLYTGDVRVEVTEYMDPIVNALSGVPMTYRSDTGNVIFSSSGMFDFRAYDKDGNELNPNPENPIDVQMNDLQPSEDGKLYQYNDSLQNWEELEASPTQDGWMDRKREILDSLNQYSDEDITNFYVLPVGTYFKYKKSRKDPYIISFETLGTRKQLKRERRPKAVLETANHDQRWVAKQEWKIDTIVDKDMMAVLKKFKTDQRKVKKYWGIGALGLFSDLDRDNAPRFLKELRIVPDIEKDNYRMHFSFKGKEYSFPVIQNFSGSIRKVQSKEKRSYATYQKEVKSAEREQKYLSDYRSIVLKKQAEVIKDRIAQYLAIAPTRDDINQEYLRFGMGGVPIRPRSLGGAGRVIVGGLGGIVGLLTFGLVNVDKPLRLPPQYLAMDKFGVDQNGERIDVPPFVRAIYMDNSGYASVPSTKVPLPRMRKTIVMFRMNPEEIAVVRDWERVDDGKKRPTLERIDITGLSPGEIRSMILND